MLHKPPWGSGRGKWLAVAEITQKAKRAVAQVQKKKFAPGKNPTPPGQDRKYLEKKTKQRRQKRERRNQLTDGRTLVFGSVCKVPPGGSLKHH